MNDDAAFGIFFGRIAATLPVRDMDKALAFYVQTLGFKKVFENGSPVGFAILKKDEAELHLSLQPNHTASCFNVAHMIVQDAEALRTICVHHGRRIIKRLQDKDYGLKAFVFEDPDGNRIDVGQVI